jgi:hypothetical protein
VQRILREAIVTPFAWLRFIYPSTWANQFVNPPRTQPLGIYSHSLQASLLTMNTNTKRLTQEKIAVVPVITMADVIPLIPEHIEIPYFQIDAQGHDLQVRHSALHWHWQCAPALWRPTGCKISTASDSARCACHDGGWHSDRREPVLLWWRQQAGVVINVRHLIFRWHLRFAMHDPCQFPISIDALTPKQADVVAYMSSVGFKKVMWQVLPEPSPQTPKKP